MSYHGDIRLGDTIDIKFTTSSASTGAPTTLAGSPVISAYPANSTTQITAGITLTVDFDGVTGYHNVRVVASSGNGYLTATNYNLAITTGTVGGTSAVGYTVGSFSIENRSAVMPTTAARTLLVDASGRVDVASIQGIPQFTAIAVTANGGTSTSVQFPAATVTTAQCPVGGSIGVYSGTGAFQVMPSIRAVTSNAGFVTEAFGPTSWVWPVTNAAAGSVCYIHPAPGYVVSPVDAVWSVTSRQLSADGNQALLDTQLTESYAAVSTVPTVSQTLLLLQQMLAGNFAISGTTITVYETDGSTVAATFTLDDATDPTSLARAT